MKIICLIFLILISACSTNNKTLLTISEKKHFLAKLEKKIDRRTHSNYGNLILKYNLINFENDSNYSDCILSSLYNDLLNNEFSKEEYKMKIRNLSSYVKVKSKEVNLLQLASNNANIKLQNLNLIAQNLNLPAEIKAKLNIIDISTTNKIIKDVFSVMDEKIINVNSKNYPLAELNIINKYFQAIPIFPPMKSFKITSNFGMRIDPFKKVKSKHTGIDLQGDKNTKIYAANDGIVTFIGKENNYGNLIIIDHGHNYKTYYGHLNEIYVEKNQIVTFNQIIASQGKTGRSTNDHLHYEIRYNNIPQDPKYYISVRKCKKNN